MARAAPRTRRVTKAPGYGKAFAGLIEPAVISGVSTDVAGVPALVQERTGAVEQADHPAGGRAGVYD